MSEAFDDMREEASKIPLDEILCQDVDCKSHLSKPSCPTCGGYGSVLLKVNCPTCKTDYWIRPGNRTIFDGKQTKTIDGVVITHRVGALNTCSHCEVEDGQG